MKATVYYIELTKDQVDELNASGWGSTIGKAYLAAKDGKIDSTNFDLLVKAATMLDARDAEHVWVTLQNQHEPWRNQKEVTCLLHVARSMDVGDIIIWEDGRRERCASAGFTQVHGVWED